MSHEILKRVVRASAAVGVGITGAFGGVKAVESQTSVALPDGNLRPQTSLNVTALFADPSCPFPYSWDAGAQAAVPGGSVSMEAQVNAGSPFKQVRIDVPPGGLQNFSWGDCWSIDQLRPGTNTLYVSIRYTSPTNLVQSSSKYANLPLYVNLLPYTGKNDTK